MHPRTPLATKLRWRLGIIVLIGVLGGCGGEDGRSSSGARADEAAVKEALARERDALYDGDGARACSLYTSSYRRQFVKENRADKSELAPKGASCREQVKEIGQVVERLVPGRKIKVIRVTVRGERAAAVSEFNTPRGKTQLKEFLLRQDGDWKIDADQEAGEPTPPGW